MKESSRWLSAIERIFVDNKVKQYFKLSTQLIDDFHIISKLQLKRPEQIKIFEHFLAGYLIIQNPKENDFGIRVGKSLHDGADQLADKWTSDLFVELEYLERNKRPKPAESTEAWLEILGSPNTLKSYANLISSTYYKFPDYDLRKFKLAMLLLSLQRKRQISAKVTPML